MLLSSGTRLGPYEIVAPLGAGGMGEVYRAKDTRLGRDVAVKVLPQHLSSNPEIRARFEREAKTVSSLNHPNICTLYDVGREGDTDYLVMELIEGETLAQRLTKGALPPADVLKIGAQIADALDRAHRAGVMHRDLKPGNVMLTRSGAKLMDFGLARATGLGAVTDLTSSPTVVGPLTAEGTIIGTFQYMAPEQLEGQEVDARADLWALGCVLYEMATGRRAFDGKSQASLIAAVMHTSPAPVSQVSPMSPPALDGLVQACLAKDPADRIQSAHDVKLQLTWIAEGGSKVGVAAPVVARRKSREPIAWALAAAGIMAAVAMFAFRPPPKDVEPIFASIPAPPGTELTPYWTEVVLSPDGSTVAFVAKGPAGTSLWVRPLGSETARPLPETASDPSPLFWSYDGRFLAYFGEGKLKKVAIDGGSPVAICNAKIGRGGTWNRDGVILFAPAPEGPLLRVSAGGGEPAPATTLDASRHEASHRFPYFLPDGDHFLFAALPPGPGGWDTFIGSLKSKSVKKVLTAGSAAIFAEPGYLVFARDGRVMAQRFDTGRFEVTGDAVAIGNVPEYSNMDAEPVAAASRNGRLVVLQSDAPQTKLQWLDRGGAVQAALNIPPGPWKVQRLSPDGRRASVMNGTDLWLVDLERSMPTRFASTNSTESTMAWSPDGSRIAYVSKQTGRSEIFVASADGAGSPELVPTTDAQFKYIFDWSPDGQFVVFGVNDPLNKNDIWLLPMSGERKPERYLASPYAENLARVSPDGRWLAYDSDESGAREVYVQSFPKPGHKVRVSSEGGIAPSWSSGGKELRYRSGDGATMSVPAEAGAEFRPGQPHKLFTISSLVTGASRTADGDRILVSEAIEAPRRQIRLFVNWTAALPR
jgi:eukaryotic-like serine/threonine-protein kinase